MASYSTTAALLTNLWMDGWIISYPFASVPKTTVPSLSSIIGVVCGCAGGTNCRTLISKSPTPWHALTLACHIRMIGTSASCLVTSLDSSSNNANRFASPRLHVASFAMQHDWSSVSLAPRLYHYHYGPRASYLGSSFLSAVH